MKGKVLYAEEHIVNVSNSTKSKSKPSQVAYEDIQLVPDSNILQELDQLELNYPIDLLTKDQEDNDGEGSLDEMDTSTTETLPETDVDEYQPTSIFDDLSVEDPPLILDEFSYWCSHPSHTSTTESLNSDNEDSGNYPSLDLGRLSKKRTLV